MLHSLLRGRRGAGLAINRCLVQRQRQSRDLTRRSPLVNDTLCGGASELTQGREHGFLKLFGAGFAAGQGGARTLDSGAHRYEVLQIAGAALDALTVAFFC